MTVTRAQLVAAIDPRDWLFNSVSLDDFVHAVLLDETIDVSPALLAQLELSLRGRRRTLANIRRLA